MKVPVTLTGFIELPDIPTPEPAPESTPAPPGPVVQVGPTREVKTMWEAANLARAGHVTIELDGGHEYSGAWFREAAHHVTIRGVGPTKPVVRGGAVHGADASNRGVLQIVGENCTVENIHFIGAASAWNSACLYLVGHNSTVRNCTVENGKNGIMHTISASGEHEVEGCEFINCGLGGDKTHPIYFGSEKPGTVFTARRCTFGRINGASNYVRTHADLTRLLCNDFGEHSDDRANGIVLSPKARGAEIIGNLFRNAWNTSNASIGRWDRAPMHGPSDKFIFAHNTLVLLRDLSHGFLLNQPLDAIAEVLVANNLVIGDLLVGDGAGPQTLTVRHNGDTFVAGQGDVRLLDEIGSRDIGWRPSGAAVGGAVAISEACRPAFQPDGTARTSWDDVGAFAAQ